MCRDRSRGSFRNSGSSSGEAAAGGRAIKARGSGAALGCGMAGEARCPSAFMRGSLEKNRDAANHAQEEILALWPVVESLPCGEA